MGIIWDRSNGNHVGLNKWDSFGTSNGNDVGLNKWESFGTEVMGIMWD